MEEGPSHVIFLWDGGEKHTKPRTETQDNEIFQVFEWPRERMTISQTRESAPVPGPYEAVPEHLGFRCGRPEAR
jgi:hypothetical protein